MEHRFRPVKEQSKALRAAVAKSIDPKTVNVLDKAGTVAAVFISFSHVHIRFLLPCLPLVVPFDTVS